MKAERLAVVQGWDDTRVALRRWNKNPVAIARPWALGSLAVTATLLALTLVVALLTTADPTAYGYPGLTRPATLHDFGFLLYRNGLVLALHAFACVAGFIAGSQLPTAARGHTGFARKLHDRAGTAAIAFVAAATLFSLGTQAFALGTGAASLAGRLHVSPFVLLVALLPHALPELFALFLPLAAWSLASSRGAWKELLAATFVTTAVAIPLLVLAAAIETWITPDILRWVYHHSYTF
jgi:stage II sporulation SpoM-like protein